MWKALNYVNRTIFSFSYLWLLSAPEAAYNSLQAELWQFFTRNSRVCQKEIWARRLSNFSFDWCLCFFTARIQLTFSVLRFRAHIRTWNPLIHNVVLLIWAVAFILSAIFCFALLLFSFLAYIFTSHKFSASESVDFVSPSFFVDHNNGFN